MVEATKKEIEYVGYFPHSNPSVFEVLRSAIEKMSKVKYVDEIEREEKIIIKRRRDTDFFLKYEIGDLDPEDLIE